MRTVNDLPTDIEKYTIPRFLSVRELSLYSSVDRRRRDLYNLSYWEKRVKDEGKLSLNKYIDTKSPSLRYIRTKKYLLAKKAFDLDCLMMKSVKGFYHGSDDSICNSFALILKYGNTDQCIDSMMRIKMFPVFDSKIYRAIGQYASSDFIGSSVTIVRAVIPILLLCERLDTLKALNLSKKDIIENLFIKSIRLPRNSLRKILDHAKTLPGDSGKVNKFYLQIVPSLVSILQEEYPLLMPLIEEDEND